MSAARSSNPPHEPSPEALDRIAAHAGRLGTAPRWILARELGVTVLDLEAYEERYRLPHPLRPLTTRRRVQSST